MHATAQNLSIHMEYEGPTWGPFDLGNNKKKY